MTLRSNPFACIRTERLVDAALAGDLRAKEILRRLTLPHDACVRVRDFEICKLALLIRGWSPGISARSLSMTIEAAMHERQADKDLNKFSVEERQEIANHATAVRFWMDGAKTTLHAGEISRVIRRGS